MTVVVILKKDSQGWSLYSEKGHLITGPHHLALMKDTPLEWANKFVACWGWTVRLEETDESKD